MNRLTAPYPLPRWFRALTAAAFGLLALSGPLSADERAPVDPATVFGAVVGVLSQVPADARTARSLGTERQGSGIVIGGDGLVLTIGYLILEAQDARVVTADGEFVPAEVVGYDHNSGFGLLRALKPLNVSPVQLGESTALEVDAPVLAVSFGGARSVTPGKVVSRRVFAGYWEYLLEDAIFVMPPHPQYGGAALIGADGRLVGVGSLLVGDAAEPGTPGPGNMFVPIDALKPILRDLLEHGRPSKPSHPWLGVYTDETGGRVFIAHTAPGGPAEKAGLKAGDIIMGVGGKRVTNMADFLRKVWAHGDAGVDVPIDVLPLGTPDLSIRQIMVSSMDRYRWLKLKPSL